MSDLPHRDGNSTEPASFSGMRTRIVERYPQLSPQCQIIAQFALSNPDTMAVETASQLAKRLMVQPSSLVRFAQALGYRGFNEMKQGFRANLIYRMADAHDREATIGQPRTGPSAVLDRLFTEGRAEIERLSREMDRHLFEQAVDELARCRDIYVVAQHLAFPFACLFSWTLLMFQRQSHLIDNVGGFATRRSELASADDAMVVLSFAPYQASVVNSARRHAARGGAVVAITDTPLSPLAPAARVLLEVPHRMPTSSHALAGVASIVQALGIAVGEKWQEECRGRAEDAADAEWDQSLMSSGNL